MTPNFVFLTIDSLRADHVTPELMPNLTELTEEGVSFTQAYANGYSTPISFPTILTGTYADHYGGHEYMAPERPFLASVFDAAEYRTAAFHSNPHLRKEKNYHTGFDTYNDFDDEAGSVSQIRYLITQNLDSDSRLYGLLKRIYHLFRTKSKSRDYARAPTLNDRALSWLEDGDGPFFLWNHYMDVHYPFYPPSEFLADVSDRTISDSEAISLNGRMHEEGEQLTDEEAADLNALYRGEVRYMDHHLGELIDELRERNRYEDTVFAVTSDHGELFGEHGIFGHPPSGYQESYHVPLVLFGPGLPSGVETDAFTSLIDLPPTVADLFDFDYRDKWEGESVLEYAEGDSPDKGKTAVLGDKKVLTCQSEDWRLVWWRERRNPDGSGDEFDLRSVSTNESVTKADNANVVDRFKQRLDEFIERTKDSETLDEPEVDQTTEDRLEALGYK